MQTTIKYPVVFSGVGLHSGKLSRIRIAPAAIDRGIVFRRLDVEPAVSEVPAHWKLVDQSPLCTRLVNTHGVSVTTVEHVMAALSGCGIRNAIIEVTGPEIPILDGSSAQFVRGILARGIRVQDAPLKVLRVLKPVEVVRGDARASLTPHETLAIEFSIEFDDAAIGAQRKVLDMSNGSFVRELCSARTFCRQSDVDNMRANGFALGGASGVNAVVFDGERVLSPGGLRQPDEPVRHKMLDALGDLALAEFPILGRYSGVRAGHAMTNQLLRALFDDPSNYELVACDSEIANRLPGAGVQWDAVPAVA
ncbi:MAG: UDP-3-O-acyl-N-acetylglucosamine deacetylase [Pseudomonadota bacterium]